MDLCWQSNVSAFNMLSKMVIAFLPRSKCLLVSWLQSPSAVILEPKKIKSATVSIVSPSICHAVMGLNAMMSVFWMLSFKPAFSLSFFTFIKKLFSSSSLRRCHLHIWGYLVMIIVSHSLFFPQEDRHIKTHVFAWKLTGCTNKRKLNRKNGILI